MLTEINLFPILFETALLIILVELILTLLLFRLDYH